MSIEIELLKNVVATFNSTTPEEYNLLADIEAELAKPDPEPVGVFNGQFWVLGNGKLCFQVTCFGAMPHVGTKLYTSPKARKSLSDDEILQAGAIVGFDIDYECPDTGKYGFRNDDGDVDNESMFAFARAIEKALQDR
jgi:hypothetical protein